MEVLATAEDQSGKILNGEIDARVHGRLIRYGKDMKPHSTKQCYVRVLELIARLAMDIHDLSLRQNDPGLALAGHGAHVARLL